MELVTTAVFDAAAGYGARAQLRRRPAAGAVDDGLDRLDVPVAQTLVLLALSAVVGVVDAVLPSIRMVRLNALRAIATE